MPPKNTHHASSTHTEHIQHITDRLTINLQTDAQPTVHLHPLPHSSSLTLRKKKHTVDGHQSRDSFDEG